VAGKRAADKYRTTLVELFEDAAHAEVLRRRATVLDTVDYERGFEQIANPWRRQRVIGIIADVAGAFGAGAIGYGTNIFTAELPNRTTGFVARGGGAILTLVSLALKWFLPGG